MTIDVRTCTRDELPRAIETLSGAFAWDVQPSDLERLSLLMEPDRTFGSFDGDRMVGAASAFSFDMSVQGGRLPCAGVTAVGVTPTHRRRGLLRRMMTELTEQSRRRGEPVAALWASEEPIYQRFGYGLGSLRVAIDIERAWSVFRDAPASQGTVRIVDAREAVKIFPALYERARDARPGMMSRSELWWSKHRLHDPSHRRDHAGKLEAAVCEIDGSAQAYVLYRRKDDWDGDGLPAGELRVEELIAVTPEAGRAMWRYPFTMDLITRIQAFALEDDTPLLTWLMSPRRLRLRRGDALWVRIVDVAGALSGRSYPASGTVVLEIDDPLCPWNAGRWQLEAVDGEASVTETEQPPDLRMSINELASVYTGCLTFGALHNAGRVQQLTPGAVERAEGLFRTSLAPWCPEVF